MSEMSQRIHDRRIELKLTLEDVGNAVGVAKSTVKKWESGKIANMRRDKIAALANALKVSPAYLMDWPEEEKIKATQDKPGGLDQTEYDKLTSAHKAVVNSLIHQLLASQSEK